MNYTNEQLDTFQEETLSYWTDSADFDECLGNAGVTAHDEDYTPLFAKRTLELHDNSGENAPEYEDIKELLNDFQVKF